MRPALSIVCVKPIQAAALVFLALGAPAIAQDEPKAAPTTPKRPAIYDAKLDARTQVATATARARRDNTRVLVMFGFNSCGWCHKLHALFDSNPEIKKLLRDEYVTAMVDIGSPNADELLLKCKEALSKEEREHAIGFPFLAVLDAEGKVVTAQRTDPLEQGDHHDPKLVKAFLAKWVAEPKEAGSVLKEALARAGSEDKRVLLHFGAPWCGWCHRLDDFLARDEIAAVIGRDYLDVKIDVDRMTNGKDVLGRYPNASDGGIPWIAILDPNGEVLATSNGPKGNIGYPAEPHEIAHFLAMLKKTVKRIEPEQLDRIESSLKEAAAKIKAASAH